MLNPFISAIALLVFALSMSQAYAEGGDHGSGNGGDGLLLSSSAEPVNAGVSVFPNDPVSGAKSYHIYYQCDSRVTRNERHETIYPGRFVSLDVELKFEPGPTPDLDRPESNCFVVCVKTKTERSGGQPAYCDLPRYEGQQCQQQQTPQQSRDVVTRLSECAPNLLELERKVFEDRDCSRLYQIQQQL